MVRRKWCRQTSLFRQESGSYICLPLLLVWGRPPPGFVPAYVTAGPVGDWYNQPTKVGGGMVGGDKSRASPVEAVLVLEEQSLAATFAKKNEAVVWDVKVWEHLLGSLFFFFLTVCFRNLILLGPNLLPRFEPRPKGVCFLSLFYNTGTLIEAILWSIEL